MLAMLASLLSPQPAFADPIAAQGSATLTGSGIVRFSTPVLADLDGNGSKEIVVGTSDGKVFAVRYTGVGSRLAVLWMHDTTADLGGATSIRDAVAIGDLDGDGTVEVVVPVGEVFALQRQGGVVILDGATGQTKRVRRSYDFTGDTGPDGYLDGVVATPALVDLDNDGQLEILWSSFDHRVYAMRLDGSMLPGWPVFVRDTSWTTPALADIDGDGFLEAVFGVDSHLEGPPYNTPDGGALIAFRADGTRLWTRFISQTIFSSPIIADLDGDGNLEIVHGGGDYFNSAGAIAAGRKVYVLDRNGNLLWSRDTGNCVCRRPALGDIDGDGKLEVVVTSYDNRAYAWNHDGSALWDVAVLNFQGKNERAGPPVIADFTGDGIADVLVNTGWETAVLNGPTGAQRTATFFPGDSRPSYNGEHASFDNGAIIADVDGDGKSELIIASASTAAVGKVFLWDLTANALPGGSAPKPFDSIVVSHTLPAMMQPGRSQTATITLRNTGSSAWTTGLPVTLRSVPASDPFTSQTTLALSPGESIASGQSRVFTLSLRAPNVEGYYDTTWRLSGPSGFFGRAVRSRIKVGSQPALQALATHGIFAGGMMTAALPAPTGFPDWSAAFVWKLLPTGRGYQMLDSYGRYWWGGDAFPYTSRPPDATIRDMVLGLDGVSYLTLQSNGEIWRCDPQPPCKRAYTGIPTGINARSLAVTPDAYGMSAGGVYVMDGSGNLYRDGNAPALSTPAGLPLAGDVMRRIKLAPAGGAYGMDTSGRLWRYGPAPELTPRYTPQLGQDWARDFELSSDGAGYYLLARDNAIHAGGAAPPLTLNLPPVFGDDAGRDLELADSRRPPQVSSPARAFMPTISR
jgi:hypothetical protein